MPAPRTRGRSTRTQTLAHLQENSLFVFFFHFSPLHSTDTHRCTAHEEHARGEVATGGAYKQKSYKKARPWKTCIVIACYVKVH